MKRLHKALLALAAICCTGRVNAIDTPTPNAQPSSNNPNTFASFANNVGDAVKDFGDDVEGTKYNKRKITKKVTMVVYFISLNRKIFRP